MRHACVVMLNTDTVTPYLLAHGLLDTGAIVDGELTITSAARRNRNLRIEGPAGVAYLLKQPGDPAQGSSWTLRREGAFYSFCQQQEAAAAAMTRFLPALVRFDAEEALLVLELLRDAAPLWQHYWAHDAAHFPVEASRAFGHALGVLHKTFRLPGLIEDPRLSWLRRDVPWVMLVHKPGPELLATMSAANYQTLRILQTQEDLSRQLDRLRCAWQPDTLIHNDIKGDNVLVVPASGQDSTTVEVRIVDWEMAQGGDPAWDLAGALQDFTMFWVASLSLAAGVSVEDAIARARYPWAAVQAAIRAFWQGYRQTAGLGVAEASALLVRAVRFSAARLIQSAYELAEGAARLTAQGVLLLQMSANLLNEAELSQVHFYGIPLAASGV